MVNNWNTMAKDSEKTPPVSYLDLASIFQAGKSVGYTLSCQLEWVWSSK